MAIGDISDRGSVCVDQNILTDLFVSHSYLLNYSYYLPNYLLINLHVSICVVPLTSLYPLSLPLSLSVFVKSVFLYPVY